MTSKQVWLAIGLLVVVLAIWCNVLKQREADLNQHLDDLKTVQGERHAVKKRLEIDIDAVQSLQADMSNDEIEMDARFATLQETLENIQTKLHGVEELSRAVNQLEQEYSELKFEIKAYEDDRQQSRANR